MDFFDDKEQFLQIYSESIAEILDLDVTILNDKGVRISGTGYYRNQIGESVPEGSFYKMILEKGQPGIIYEIQEGNSKCMSCHIIKQCKELATIGVPIIKCNHPIGIIGVTGFSSNQKERIINNSDKLIKFLQNIGASIESNLVEIDYNKAFKCKMAEQPIEKTKEDFFAKILGQNESLQKEIKKAKKVANSLSTVLIRGESGTGKELFAKAMHYESNRRNFPFIAINCSAIPENLLESELFGYEGGAFTGSRRDGNIGKFEMAHRGTIFLDEIGDLPLHLQPKILRVLQERSIEKIGGRKSIPIDVKVIAATHRNLEEMVKKGTFREDLYYRINVIPLTIPPLRQRQDDIVLYLRHFVRKYCEILGRNLLIIDPYLEQLLIEYSWPGNIRQLENAVEYMVNMAEEEMIRHADLPNYLIQDKQIKNKNQQSLDQMIANYEKQILVNYFSIEENWNNKTKVAQELQISLPTLYRKIEKYNIVQS